MLSTYLRNALLDAVGNATSFSVASPHLSLHDGLPGLTGANEVTGGSYARQPTSFGAAAAGDMALDTTESFASMPAATVVAVGLFDAVSAGNFLAFGYLGNFLPVPFTTVDSATADTLVKDAHGLVNDDRVVLTAEFGGTLPTGPNDTTLYWVVNSATDSFQVSLTQGGGAVAITADGEGYFIKVVPKSVGSGDTFQVASGNFTLSLR